MTSDLRKTLWTDRPCPVPDCEYRITDAGTGGRHLERAHESVGRWAASKRPRYQDVEQVDGGDTIIYDIENGHAWVQSDLSIEVGGRRL